MKFMRYDDEQWETCHTLDAHKTLIVNLVKDRPTHKWNKEVKRVKCTSPSQVSMEYPKEESQDNSVKYHHTSQSIDF